MENPIRVAFLTQGLDVPASRFRVEQVLPALREGGDLQCTMLPCVPSVYGDSRKRWVRGRRREMVRPLSLLSRASQVREALRHDVLYFQRPLVEYYTTVFEEILGRLRPSIFDLDDAIFLNFYGLERFKVRRILKLVDHVVVGNRFLADFVAEPSRTTLIPTVVDVKRYTPRTEPEGPFTIGWTGISVNLLDIKPIRDALKEVLARTGGRLLVITDRLNAPWLEGFPIDFVRWSPETEVSALDAAHVGIMPLEDIPYNRGKCGFKLIQYMARAIPVVASPYGANAEIVRNGIDGLHATSHDEWVSALMTLASDRDARLAMGAEARKRIELHYSVEAVAPLYRQVIRSVAR